MNKLGANDLCRQLIFSLGASSLYVSYPLPRYVDLLGAFSLLRNLEKVTLLLPRAHDSQSKKLFAQCDRPAFPQTRHLRIYRTSRYILAHCPDIRSLTVLTEDHAVQGGQEAQHMSLLLSEAGKLQQLRRFDYACGHWGKRNREVCSSMTLQGTLSTVKTCPLSAHINDLIPLRSFGTEFAAHTSSCFAYRSRLPHTRTTR